MQQSLFMSIIVDLTGVSDGVIVGVRVFVCDKIILAG
jgi:hypothetical protein